MEMHGNTIIGIIGIIGIIRIVRVLPATSSSEGPNKVYAVFSEEYTQGCTTVSLHRIYTRAWREIVISISIYSPVPPMAGE